MNSIDPSLVRFEEHVPAGANWSHVLKRGTTLRITDIETILYGIAMLGEPRDPMRLALMGMILIGIVGLKYTSAH